MVRCGVHGIEKRKVGLLYVKGYMSKGKVGVLNDGEGLRDL